MTLGDGEQHRQHLFTPTHPPTHPLTPPSHTRTHTHAHMQVCCEEVLEEVGYSLQPHQLLPVSSVVSSAGITGSQQAMFFAQVGCWLGDWAIVSLYLPSSTPVVWVCAEHRRPTHTLSFAVWPALVWGRPHTVHSLVATPQPFCTAHNMHASHTECVCLPLFAAACCLHSPPCRLKSRCGRVPQAAPWLLRSEWRP